MLKLKDYQRNALGALREFLQQCQGKTAADAFATVLALHDRSETYQETFEGVPTVCLRVPTGGGKTLLAAHSVALAGQTVLGTDAPVALWLTPSDAIRTQTMEALSNARHPYRQALAQSYGERVRVCDLESLQTIGPQDVGRTCIIVVATIQSFNVTDTAKRNVYSFFEELAPHFDGLSPQEADGLETVSEADLEHQPYLTAADVGRVKYSVANWLHRQRPIVIVDEAHNNRTHRFFNSLGRMNPGCVVELTATPVPTNNVLYHVAASELKAEDMIKLPIVLVEHPTGWQGCLHDAHLTRKRLEEEALGEDDYVRPILLIQAEPKNGAATVEVVKQYLLDDLNIPEERIKVATGSQKELDGVDLFDPACPVRFVITVEALKEGWDCPFAYVLASLQSVNSAKDVEQLLGRVLRMPYAEARKKDSLNKAYAHIVAANFAEAASTLKDRMVQNMGFERFEAAGVVVQPQQHEVELVGGEGRPAKSELSVPDCHIQLPAVPDTEHWPEDLKTIVDFRETSAGATMLIKGGVSSADLDQAEAFVTQSVPQKKQDEVKAQFSDYRATRRALVAPERLGVAFAPIPQLCLELDGYLEVVERETLAELGEWDLLSQPVQLEGFEIHESVNAFEIDVKGERVKYSATHTQQLKLNDIASNVTEQDLVRWLDRETRQAYMMQAQLQGYLLKMLRHLTADRGFTLTQLVRAKHVLVRAITSEIQRLRALAMVEGFTASLPGMTTPPPEELMNYSFQYQPGMYPARNVYQGSYEFQKHYYPLIHDLKEKKSNGKDAEEFICARAIDSHSKIKHWVRNIEQQERFSFWLPRPNGNYFYPDFVAELTDGRVLAVEYKGDHLASADEAREKKQVGEQWERSSNGRCLFLFAVKDDLGRDVVKQIQDKLGG